MELKEPRSGFQSPGRRTGLDAPLSAPVSGSSSVKWAASLSLSPTSSQTLQAPAPCAGVKNDTLGGAALRTAAGCSAGRRRVLFQGPMQRTSHSRLPLPAQPCPCTVAGSRASSLGLRVSTCTKGRSDLPKDPLTLTVRFRGTAPSPGRCQRENEGCTPVKCWSPVNPTPGENAGVATVVPGAPGLQVRAVDRTAQPEGEVLLELPVMSLDTRPRRDQGPAFRSEADPWGFPPFDSSGSGEKIWPRPPVFAPLTPLPPNFHTRNLPLGRPGVCRACMCIGV